MRRIYFLIFSGVFLSATTAVANESNMCPHPKKLVYKHNWVCPTKWGWAQCSFHQQNPTKKSVAFYAAGIQNHVVECVYSINGSVAAQIQKTYNYSLKPKNSENWNPAAGTYASKPGVALEHLKWKRAN